MRLLNKDIFMEVQTAFWVYFPLLLHCPASPHSPPVGCLCFYIDALLFECWKIHAWFFVSVWHLGTTYERKYIVFDFQDWLNAVSIISGYIRVLANTIILCFKKLKKFHCVFAAKFLYSLLCWWTPRLFPWRSCCEQCYSKHWWASISRMCSLGVFWVNSHEQPDSIISQT